ncbi:hypothetical protein D9C73_021401 [Collichthys lucidus]|uniref:Uncharacterized protein n=1 Tax=Collichthys lucidus TaxID=240159 RepID=A0A4U5VGC0_COLLU|nr:hypothetical protein D9C73_021401 [Collichthys lucidus]
MTEEAVCSFSSSLQEFQDMDLDQVRGQDVLLMDGERPQPEGSWGRGQEDEVSGGEMRDIWTTKPHRTTNPKSSRQSAARSQTTSPGQISADLSEATNQGSAGTLTSDLQTDLSLDPLPHLEDTPTAGQVLPAVSQLNSPAGVSRRAGLLCRRVELHLPAIRLDDESAADTDSSTNL